MMLAVREVMLRLRLDAKTLFRLAHVKAFGQDVDCSTDVLLFEKSGQVPRYVQQYMVYLQGEMQ